MSSPLKLRNTACFQSKEVEIAFAAIEEELAAVKEDKEDDGLKKRRKNQQAFWKRAPDV